MELIENTPEELFKVASADLSAHCFEAGRLTYAIQLDEEAIEKKRIQLRNMRMDFDKLNKIHRKASEEFFAAKKAEKEAVLPEIPGA